jgi:FtsH-binding integral membrane protein
MTTLPFMSTWIRDLMYSNAGVALAPVFGIIAIIVELVIICNKQVARTVPQNYICLGIFTFCQAYMVAFIASVYDPVTVLAAAFMTAGVVSGLTVYAWTTKSDFTVLGGVFAMLSSALFMFMIFSFIFWTQAMNMFYCFLMVVFFGFYIIVDTQMIIGEKRYEMNEDDYILGALVLYIDIVQLFLYILKMLDNKN